MHGGPFPMSHYQQHEDLALVPDLLGLAATEGRAFLTFNHSIERADGEIPRKYRELIALGVMRRRLSEAGLSLTDQETRERFLGRRLDSAMLRIEAELGAPLPEAFSVDFSREILLAFERELKGVEGVRQAVTISNTTVLSNNPMERIIRVGQTSVYMSGASRRQVKRVQFPIILPCDRPH